MSEDSTYGEPRPRKYQWRYGPLRIVMPWLCIAAGILMAIKGAFDVGTNASAGPLFLILGASLIVLGVVAFFVYRWMAKRGI
ncbi:hypothetical protein [Cryobacterium zhongshanensis]|uniref:Uncharacterized protein n=1 Tax=Cryobacterium zhongshanensis TaxID=2928153 RepID=A0AA41QUS1_9MICO|nr:hypothetical protein [Cryobacterium zhongshanensis]MCI4658082.1 hypothetical protein [Cryobacterium zhongshanensis]